MIAERRRQPRVEVTYAAIVRGVDAQGQLFEEHTQVLNMSTGGLRLCLRRSVAEGVKLFIYFRCAATLAASALAVAAHGVVQRVEVQPNGASLGVMFRHYRCL